MRYFLLQIKWAYQRVHYGYDDRIMWQFDSYFIQIIPALKKFCLNQLEDKEHAKLNEGGSKIYSNTLNLIEDWEQATVFDENFSFEKEDEALVALAEYFGKNINIYWD